MKKLKELLEKTGLSREQIAESLGISRITLWRLLCKDARTRDPDGVKAKLVELLMDCGIPEREICKALQIKSIKNKAAVKTTAILKSAKPATLKKKEEARMIRKQTLTPQAKRHFQIPREIFSDILCSHEDLFFSKSARYIRESLYHTAKHGGMLALVGESGSGKSTLRRDLIDRIEREDNSRIIIIEPYVIGMDDSKDHHILKAHHITDAILNRIAPSIKAASSPEARFRAMHKALRDSAQAGYRHCLIIEEAHALSATTIKQLKRFYELELGLARLLSIILIGQPELRDKLSEITPAVREVVQRMELIEIPPMDDLEGYVKHRCSSAGAKFDGVFGADALDALIRHLEGPRSQDGRKGVSLLYPLIVGNTLTRAINTAAELGMEKVTGDVVRRA